jgi:DNA-directed RNA polymerase specialized sigma24 family protein
MRPCKLPASLSAAWAWNHLKPRRPFRFAAENGLAELERWPGDGVPQKAEAWLLLVARNRLIDSAHRNHVRQNSEMFLQQIAEEAQAVAARHDHFPDEWLTTAKKFFNTSEEASRSQIILN